MTSRIAAFKAVFKARTGELDDGVLAINASMGTEGGEEEDGVAGIYITKIK